MGGASGGGGGDFTSALYLGLRHASRELGPWNALTRGVPAALASPPLAGGVARRLAALQGCEAATLLPSTLHLFWDLFGILAPTTSGIWVDAGTYPIVRWGTERARTLGVPIYDFAHHDAGALGRALPRKRGRRPPMNERPLVVADGYCPRCGRPAPLAEYLAVVRDFDGLLVVDDTQALGIFGTAAEPGAPYGKGGGGSLRRCGISAPEVLVGCSLAKAFGAPTAALSGSRTLVRQFEEQSQTRVHCSPPSVAVIRAADRALEVNRVRGDELRTTLARRVRRFRQGLARNGLRTVGGWFPVQTLHPAAAVNGAALHSRLLAMGIQAVLHGAGRTGKPLVSFVINATHNTDEIDRAVAITVAAHRSLATRRRQCHTDLLALYPAPV